MTILWLLVGLGLIVLGADSLVEGALFLTAFAAYIFASFRNGKTDSDSTEASKQRRDRKSVV